MKQWVYKPTLLNGEAVEVDTEIDVNFTLNQYSPAASGRPSAKSNKFNSQEKKRNVRCNCKFGRFICSRKAEP